jgi:hypothetical protein
LRPYKADDVCVYVKEGELSYVPAFLLFLLFPFFPSLSLHTLDRSEKKQKKEEGEILREK